MNENIVDIFDAFLNTRLEGVHTSLPGEVVSYSKATRKASVKPLVSLRTQQGDIIELPVIEGVPVIFPSTSKVSLIFPLEKGDGCLILFSESAMGNFLNSTRVTDPEDASRFSLTDAICLPGLFSFRKAPASVTQVAVELDGLTGITLRTGDAAIWAPNTLAVDPFTGLPHSVGIVKLKGA